MTFRMVLAAGVCCGFLSAQEQSDVNEQKSAAQRAQREGAARRAPSQKAPASNHSAALTVPPGAKEVGPYLYSYTDSKGTNWMYRQTPFGVVRWEDRAVAQPVIANSNPVAVRDLGDTVEFSTRTPFGQQKWTRKKSELTDSERALLNGTDGSGPAATRAGSGDRKAQEAQASGGKPEKP